MNPRNLPVYDTGVYRRFTVVKASTPLEMMIYSVKTWSEVWAAADPDGASIAMNIVYQIFRARSTHYGHFY